MIIMVDKFIPTTEAQIANVENQLGYALPNQYRQFILRYNGGRSKDAVFDIPCIGDIGEANFFYGIDTDDCYDLLKTRSVYMGRIPESVLPIADDSCGNQICISIAPETYGKIYFWDHEMEFEPDRAILPIANSFDEFINSLRAEP